MSSHPIITALIVAGGRGTRFGSEVPKQYQMLCNKPVLTRTVETFVLHPLIQSIITVIHPDDEQYATEALNHVENIQDKPLLIAFGGATRQLSVFQGLKKIEEQGGASFVLIHDAARPFVDHALIDRAIRVAFEHKAALPGFAVSDTIKMINSDNMVDSTPQRSLLRAVQTPQSFCFDLIFNAHKKAAESQIDHFTDDGALVEWIGQKVYIFEGDPENIKLTHASDLALAEKKMTQSQNYITKVGMGFDVHAFTTGDHIWLGGVKIPHDKGVVAHSDGDVVLHALTDALLGVIAEGDIGFHFPPSDPQWKDAASDQFLREAVRLVHEHEGIIDHLDIVLLCEKPRLTPHRDAIRARIAEITGLSLKQVSIKASTTEKLGFTGRSEGIAAQCVVTLRVPLTSS